MAEVISLNGYWIYGRNEPENTWPVTAAPGQTVMVVLATSEIDRIHLQGAWQNMLDPDNPDTGIGGEGVSGTSFHPFRWVGSGEPTEVYVTVDGYASSTVYVWVMELAEGEEIGGFRYGTSEHLAPGSRIALDGAPDADGETFVMGELYWTLPS
jgi:hypothetical protein